MKERNIAHAQFITFKSAIMCINKMTKLRKPRGTDLNIGQFEKVRRTTSHIVLIVNTCFLNLKAKRLSLTLSSIVNLKTKQHSSLWYGSGLIPK